MNIMGTAVFFIQFAAAGWLTYQLVFSPRRDFITPEGLPSSGKASEQTTAALPRCSLMNWVLLIVLCALVVSSMVLLVTAAWGIFKLRTILVMLGIYDAALLFYLRWRGVLRLGWPRYRSFQLNRSDGLALGLLCLAIVVFGQPAKIVFNSSDPGVHVNIAMRIADTGSIISYDPDFRQIERWEQQKLFLPVPLTVARNPKPFDCFWIWNTKRAILFPNLFTFLPVWLALAYKLGGLPALFYFNIGLGLLTILLLYFIGEKLFQSRWVGLCAAILLTLSLAQIWLVRSPFSEIFAQLLILGGIWVLAHGMVLKSRNICLFAGIILGLTLFVRPDSFLVPVGLVIAIFLLGLAQKAGNADSVFPQDKFMAGLKVTTACALVYDLIFSHIYIIGVLDAIEKGFRQWGDLLVFIIFMVAVVAFVRKFQRLKAWVQEWDDSKQNRLLFGIWAVLALSIIYLWFVRPLMPPYVHQPTMSFYDKISFRFYNELNLVRLGWYLTPLGLAMACVGCFLFVRRIFDKKGAHLLPFASLLLVFAGFYLYKSNARPFNYGIIRRYIEIVIPAAVLFTALCLESIYKFLSTRFAPKVGKLASAILFFILVSWQLHVALPVMFKQEFTGALEQIKVLAEKNAAADILLFEDGNFKNYLPGPLKYIFHKSVYALATQAPDPQAFDRLMDDWQRQGKRVHLLASEEHTRLVSQHYGFVPIDHFLFQTPMFENPTDRLPQTMQNLTLPVQIYQVVPKAEIGSRASNYKLQMGQSFGVLSGFYQVERESNGVLLRWAGPQSSLELPALENSQDAWLLLQLSRPAPASVPGATVCVSFNQTMIGESHLAQSPEDLWLQIPRALIHADAANQLSFATTAYNPARLGINSDVRELGFKLESVLIQSGSHFDWDLGDGWGIKTTGFYGVERDDKNRDFRWTTGNATLALPHLDGSSDFVLSLAAGIALPKGMTMPTIKILINHQLVGEKQLAAEEDTIRFPVSAKFVKGNAGNVLEIITPAFCLAKLGLSPDQRDLGIKIYRLTLSANSESRTP